MHGVVKPASAAGSGARGWGGVRPAGSLLHYWGWLHSEAEVTADSSGMERRLGGTGYLDDVCIGSKQYKGKLQTLTNSNTAYSQFKAALRHTHAGYFFWCSWWLECWVSWEGGYEREGDIHTQKGLLFQVNRGWLWERVPGTSCKPGIQGQ